MPYKAVARRVPLTTETFEIGTTKIIEQKNGVISSVTNAKRDDGFSKRDITIFANGSRLEKISSQLQPGNKASLIGKYSQSTVFVAFDVANQG